MTAVSIRSARYQNEGNYSFPAVWCNIIYITNLIVIYQSHVWTLIVKSDAFTVLYVAFLSMHLSPPLMNDLENFGKNLKCDTKWHSMKDTPDTLPPQSYN